MSHERIPFIIYVAENWEWRVTKLSFCAPAYLKYGLTAKS